MSRYIDYDAINYRHDKLHDKSDEFLNGVVYMAQRIEEAPSIDIVRCKECKHAHADMPTEICPISCEISWGGVFENDFCSYGERKDDE